LLTLMLPRLAIIANRPGRQTSPNLLLWPVFIHLAEPK
jgi:hypothetical protein